MAGDVGMRRPGRTRPVWRVAALLSALLGVGLLTGCGKKGPPDPPGPPAAITYPKTYPTH